MLPTHSAHRLSQSTSISNERVSDERVDLDANGYKAVLDRLYPAIANPTLLRCYVMLVWEMFLGRLAAQAYVLPVIHQQTYAAMSDNGTLLNATFGKHSYAISVATGQTQIFVSFTLIIFIWCGPKPKSIEFLPSLLARCNPYNVQQIFNSCT